ncbi:hypothetical protein ACJRO7_033548 [Eucalyptus globulus]|uniref:TIR domain-containing protein n=1 Tax=Eucalyptus globulus TaxID=34317 RepID=A0ABD3JPQ7_EUCGL
MEKPMESGYEVFLSFRGPDTRRDIADYLYSCLIQIRPELLQAIKQSDILIPIFSKGYAASPWCLMELVQMIMPIFYNVAPSEVRYQTGSYGEAINLHINKWRGKGEFTEEVVRKLLIELKKNYLAVSNCLVEMDDQVDQIVEKIGEQTTGTKIVGIYGMGGVGKTTLATIVYNKLSADFDNCCFLSNIRETKIVSLQNQLISKVLRMEWPSINSINEGITEIKNRLSSKKVLLVLDDVDQNTQLEALVRTGDSWFGRGSKVIITTRNEEVLKYVDFKLELTEMDFDHALQLFSRHAFRRDYPPAEYFPLSKKAVEICGHLPLALEIIGSLLAGKDKNKWNNVLEKLEAIPNKEVKSKLRISFEALETQEQEIFLDVCCFFAGFDVRIVNYMWDSCDFLSGCSLEVLEQRSLIKITKGNRLWVHNQLRDLGRDIVRERAKEKQTRVWDHEEAIDVLEIKEGRENVEAISLKFDHQFQDFFEKEESIKFSKLRFLQVDCGDLDENNVQHFPSANRFQWNPIKLPKLRWLSWHKFPILFDFTALSMSKLVILDLSGSKITDEWEGWNHLKMAKNLKVLNLTGCRNLRKTPDLSAHGNLERLILEGCTELVQVDRSIGRLKHLVSLNLRGCGKLKTLPDEMGELETLTELQVDGASITKIPEGKGMEKLKILSAVSCRSLTELPYGNFGSLIELVLSSSNIRELPNSIEMMKNLRVLRISDSSLEKLPSALRMLGKLEEIDASKCRYLSGEIPSEIGRLSFLRILSMTELYLTNNLEMTCPNLTNLLNLRVLMLELKYQSPSQLAPSLNWIGGLRKLESLWLDYDSLVTLPSDFNLLSKLRKLGLVVKNLERLPKLPQNLSYFLFDGRGLMEKSINLSYLEKLLELKVRYCEQLIEIQGLESLKNLQVLDLSHLPSLVKLPNLTGLKKLWRFRIENCPKLVEVRGQLESLETPGLVHCGSLEQLPDPLNYKHIKELHRNGCWKLEEIQGLEALENLRFLRVIGLPLLEKLPDPTNAKELKDLGVRRCPRLIEIRGRPESVSWLSIDACRSLRQISDPSSFKKLRRLNKRCERLEKILESDEYRDLKKVRSTFEEPRFRRL